jgi:hypothetical protein
MSTEFERRPAEKIFLSRSRTRSAGCAMAVFAVVFFGSFSWFFRGFWMPPALISAAILAFAGYLIWKNSRLELTIEDGHLCWVDEFSDNNGRVAIADISGIRLDCRRGGNGEYRDNPDFVIVMSDHKNILLPMNIVPSCSRVIEALTRINPQIKVEETMEP